MTQKLSQQSKALAPENLRSLGEARDVSARSRDALDDAKGHRIEHLNEYDRDILGSGMQSARLAGTGRNDNVRFEPNKFARKSGQARKIPIRPTPFEIYRLPGMPAEVTQAFFQNIVGVFAHTLRSAGKVTYLLGAARLRDGCVWHRYPGEPESCVEH